VDNMAKADSDPNPATSASAEQMRVSGAQSQPYGLQLDRLQQYRDRSVLVAGGDGFLGVNFAMALHAAGAKVTLLTRTETPRAGQFAVRNVCADLMDVNAVAAAVENQDFIFDLAGMSGAVGSNLDPVTSTDKECRPHLTLFTAAATAASRPVLAFLSSRLVYGRPDYLPVGEEHPIRPASFYAVHKVTLEHYLRVLATTRGLRYCAFRLSNPYGPYWPEQRKTYGLINQLIARALNGEPINIFGDGAQKRDYVHIDDVVTAVTTATAAANCWGEIFNLGGDEVISIRHAAETIAAEVPGTQVCFKPWPAADLAVETGDYHTDMKKLRRFVQLPPQMTFQQGLRRTLISVRHSPLASSSS
jgi:UDP-glucose 4-epimerase